MAKKTIKKENARTIRRATSAHPHLRLVPRQHPAPCRWPGMDCQQAWEAQCEEQDDWVRSLGFDPETVATCDLVWLAKGHTARRGSARVQVLAQAEQRRARHRASLTRIVAAPPDPNFRYPVIEERLVLPSWPTNDAGLCTSTGNEAAGLDGLWRRPSPDDEPYPILNE